jgi:beta-glucosidase
MTFSFLRQLGRFLPCLALVFLTSCASFNPLGPDSKGPMPRPPRPLPHADTKFAWGISTASYQYEDPAVKPGDADYFSTDWDIMVSKSGAPKKGNALYSWTHFDKDLAALQKAGITHYRFSLEWARIEPEEGEFSVAALEHYRRMLAAYQHYKRTVMRGHTA